MLIMTMVSRENIIGQFPKHNIGPRLSGLPPNLVPWVRRYKAGQTPFSQNISQEFVFGRYRRGLV